VNGKPILLGFDGTDMSSDAGLTLLREIYRKAGLAGHLAACMADPRYPSGLTGVDLFGCPVGCVSNVVEILWRRSPGDLICT